MIETAGPFEMFGAGYRVSEAVFAGFLRHIPAISTLKVTVLMMAREDTRALPRIGLSIGRCRTISFRMLRPNNHGLIGQWRTFVGWQPHEKSAQTRQGRAQIMAVDHHVDHAMFLQEFGPLEPVGQVLADRLLDHPWSGETP